MGVWATRRVRIRGGRGGGGKVENRERREGIMCSHVDIRGATQVHGVCVCERELCIIRV